MKQLNIDGAEVMIDDEDFDRVLTLKWRLVSGYIVYSTNEEIIKLHKFIMGDNTLFGDIDHIDQNKFNNQKSNLRFCSRSQNSANVPKGKIYIGTSSLFKGVNYSKRRRYFISRITLNYKTVMIYSSKIQEECAFAYNVAAKILFGEFACINKIDFHSEKIELHVTNLLKEKYGIKR